MVNASVETATSSFTVGLDGNLLDVEISQAELPLAVQAALQKATGYRNRLDGIVDAFGPHGHDLNTLAIPNIIRDSTSYRGRIAFSGDLERHYPNHVRLLLTPLLKDIHSGFITWAPGAVNQRAFWPGFSVEGVVKVS